MKLLILSLGVGDLFDGIEKTKTFDEAKVLESMVKKENYAYRTAKYRLNGNVYESPFVAEAIIDQYKPDYILLIGTVKSAWSSFYARYYTGPDKVENIIRLYTQEKRYGLNESKDKTMLIGFEECIKSIFPKTINYGDKEIRTDVKLLSYGIDEAELDFNYKELSSKWEMIIEEADDERIELAFDITHSFRSMPLYNITILNYLSNITDKTIDLTHVYYGNLDVRNENGGIAEIVDLNGITYLNNLSSGVHEFNNSGNVSSIIDVVRANDKEIAALLERFDWAIQSNRLVLLIDSVKALRERLSEKKAGNLVGLYRMIEGSLNKSFPSEKDINDFNNISNSITSFGRIQRTIGMWHLSHGRFGQAIVCADEALHSYIIPFYIKSNGESLTIDKCTVYKDRKDAFSKVFGRNDNIYDRNANIYPELNDCVRYLKSLHEKVSANRNVFAHIVWDLEEDTDENGFDFETVIIKIRETYNKLLELELLIQDDENDAEQYMLAIIEEKWGRPQVFVFEKKSKQGKAAWGKLQDGTKALINLTNDIEIQLKSGDIKVVVFAENSKENYVLVKPIEIGVENND